MDIFVVNSFASLFQASWPGAAAACSVALCLHWLQVRSVRLGESIVAANEMALLLPIAWGCEGAGQQLSYFGSGRLKLPGQRQRHVLNDGEEVAAGVSIHIMLTLLVRRRCTPTSKATSPACACCRHYLFLHCFLCPCRTTASPWRGCPSTWGRGRRASRDSRQSAERLAATAHRCCPSCESRSARV